MKTFEAEATSAFAFLSERGFTSGTDLPVDPKIRPLSLTVRFQGPGTTVETSLALGFAGEDSILTVLNTVSGRREFGPSVARKGREMEKALLAHADGVRDALASS